jgi:hypothetical protein
MVTQFSIRGAAHSPEKIGGQPGYDDLLDGFAEILPLPQFNMNLQLFSPCPRIIQAFQVNTPICNQA